MGIDGSYHFSQLPLTNSKRMAFQAIYPIVTWIEEHHHKVCHITHWISFLPFLPVHNSFHIELCKKEMLHFYVHLQVFKCIHNVSMNIVIDMRFAI